MRFFRRRKYRLNHADRIEDLSLILFTFVFFSYGMFLCSFGAMFNIGVIINNGGRMPVLSDCDLSTERHFSFQDFDEVNYPYFADIIKVKNPFGNQSGWVSVGDLMILFSVLFLVCSTIIFTIKIAKFNKRIKKKYGN